VEKAKVHPRRRGGAALLGAGVVLTILGLFAAPANAAGESTTATLTSPTSGTSSTFVWSYQFNQNGGHGLSNIAIRFCDDSLLAHVTSASPNATVQSGGVTGGHSGFGPGIRFDTQTASGSLTVTFDQAYAIAPGAMEIQSHSGDGQQGDVINSAAGPAGQCAPVPTTTTTTLVVEDPTTTTTTLVVEDPTTTTTTVVEDPTTTTTTVVEDPTTTTTTVVEDPTTTTTTTLVEDPTTTTTVVDDPSTTTTAVDDPSTTTTVKVLSGTHTSSGGVAGIAMARTGTDTQAQLLFAGLALTLGGIAVTFGERKKRALVRT
jgi:hypothetical protein